MLFGTSLIALVAVAANIVEAHPQTAPNAKTNGRASRQTGKNAGTWRAAKQNDLRSPCPALNTAANLGVLPRDGRNVTAEKLAKAVEDLYNVDPSFAKLLAGQGFQGVSAQGAKFITLKDLAKHDVIEHDASLTRLDEKEGDNNSVQPKLVKSFLEDGEGDFITIQSIAKTRARREAESKAAGSPPLGVKATTLAYGEAALLLQTLGHLGGKDGYYAPKSAVRDWVEFERLPKGWVKPPKQITANSTTALAGQVLGFAKSGSALVVSTDSPKTTVSIL